MGLRVLKLAKQTNRSFRWLLKGFQPLDHDATPPTGLKPQFKNKGEPGSEFKAHKLPLSNSCTNLLQQRKTISRQST
jgi:hypothetical protein